MHKPDPSIDYTPLVGRKPFEQVFDVFNALSTMMFAVRLAALAAAQLDRWPMFARAQARAHGRVRTYMCVFVRVLCLRGNIFPDAQPPHQPQYGGHNVALEIQASLPTPPTVGRMMRGVHIAFILTGIAYFGVSISGFHALGNKAVGNRTAPSAPPPWRCTCD